MNPYEHDDPHGDAIPRCELKWSARCDGLGTHFIDPEFACAQCHAVCEQCQEGEWKHQYDGKRLCEACLEEIRYRLAEPQHVRVRR